MDDSAEEYWNPESDWDAAVQKPVRVEARQVIGAPEDVDIGARTVTVQPGDWIVKYPSGSLKVFRDEDFSDLFARSRGRDQSEDYETPGLSI